jgi:hypothetical protein
MGKVSAGSFGAFVAGPDSKGAANQIKAAMTILIVFIHHAVDSKSEIMVGFIPIFGRLTITELGRLAPWTIERDLRVHLVRGPIAGRNGDVVSLFKSIRQ